MYPLVKHRLHADADVLDVLSVQGFQTRQLGRVGVLVESENAALHGVLRRSISATIRSRTT